MKPPLCDRCVRRFAQDDGFAEGLKQSGGVCENHERSKRVTGSQETKGKAGFHFGAWNVSGSAKKMR
jgi:hypothetical protein